jgi:SpoVK/Ycf46/Vps4 family AAA+-type ATPase
MLLVLLILQLLITGNPGTGKTTVAKLYAGILRDLGLLSKGDTMLKTASDFVGSVLGASESQTRAILQSTEGCVCVIDEAYGLHSSIGGTGASLGGGDPYRTAVLDIIVEQVSMLLLCKLLQSSVKHRRL